MPTSVQTQSLVYSKLILGGGGGGGGGGSGGCLNRNMLSYV